MFKRNIGVVVVGMLLGAQIGLASAVPLGAEDIVAKGEPPVQTTYQAQHAGSITAASESAVSLGAEGIVVKGEPSVQATFKQQQRDSVSAASGNAVPLDAEAIVEEGEPSVHTTFQQLHVSNESGD